MKRTKIALSVLGIASMFFMVSCKKASTGKLVGTWTLSSMTRTAAWTDATDNETTTNYTVVADGMRKDSTTFNDGTGEVTVSPETSVTYSDAWTFNKDGSWSSSTTSDGTTSTQQGYWIWGGKNKSQEIKKNSYIILTLTQSIWFGNTTTYSGSGMPADMTMYIESISGSELVLMENYTETDSDGDTYVVTSTTTLTQ